MCPLLLPRQLDVSAEVLPARSNGAVRAMPHCKPNVVDRSVDRLLVSRGRWSGSIQVQDEGAASDVVRDAPEPEASRGRGRRWYLRVYHHA